MTDLLNLRDIEAAALAKLPPMVADYYQGGAEDEVTLRSNMSAWTAWRLRQRVLVDVSKCELATSVLGIAVRGPLLIAPTAFQGLADPQGECATARAAAVEGTCMVVSSLSNYSLEEIAAVAPGPRWFQLYLYRERSISESLVRRAEAAGYRALVVTVDAPVQGARERDVRNRFALPDTCRMANFSDALLASLPPREGASSLGHYINTLFDPSLDWRVVEWLRDLTRLPIVVKGVMTGEDARRAADAGADAVVVSNHGGRQLDSGQATAEVLEEVVRAVPALEVYVDGGIRRGSDVLKALALGARAVLIGRPVLWGLAVAGEDGVKRVLDILHSELKRTMQLCGCAGLSDVTPDLLRPAGRP